MLTILADYACHVVSMLLTSHGKVDQAGSKLENWLSIPIRLPGQEYKIQVKNMRFAFRPESYSKVESSEEDPTALSDGRLKEICWQCEELLLEKPSRRRNVMGSICWIWLNLTLFGVSITTFIFSLKNVQPIYPDNIERTRNYGLKQFSMPCK